MSKKRECKDKEQSVKKTTVPKARVLLIEAKSGAVGVPVAVQPEPKHHDLATELNEKRDKQVAALVLHDRAPQEHSLTRKQLTEDSDALGLNDKPIL